MPGGAIPDIKFGFYAGIGLLLLAAAIGVAMALAKRAGG